MPPQPARALQHLIENADRLVTRQELQQVLWGDGRHVNFEQGLNYCIRQLREILQDEAEDPRYISTVLRRGYRFLAPVVADARGAATRRRIASRYLLIALGILALALAAVLWFLAAGGNTGKAQLAVAPFATPSMSEEDRLAAHVLHEELLVQLAGRAPQLAVAVPESEGAEAEAPLRLEGSVYRVDGELTLALRLVRTEDLATLWGRTFRQLAPGDAWRGWPAEAASAIAEALSGDAAEEGS